LKEPSYTFVFDFKTTESGQADRVKLKDAFPGDGGIASCLVDAIEGMEVPPSVLSALLEEAESKAKAEAVSPGPRGLMGNVFVLGAGGAVGLIQTMVLATGVTIVVVVAVALTAEAIEAVSKRRRAQCLKMYIDCESRPYPCTKPRDWTYNICSHCQTNCLTPTRYFSDLCKECGFR
jgi:hypothetical protein